MKRTVSALTIVVLATLGPRRADALSKRQQYNQSFSLVQSTTNQQLVEVAQGFDSSSLSKLRDAIVSDALDLADKGATLAAHDHNWFLTWTIGGLTIGLGGAAVGAFQDSDKSKKRTAQVTAASLTAVTGIIAATKFDGESKRLSACSADLKRLASNFDVKWGNATGLDGYDSLQSTDKKKVIDAFVGDARAIFELKSCQPAE